jgi:hypothetical protein
VREREYEGMKKIENVPMREEGRKKIIIRKDCFQVKSNLLTVDNLVFHF